MATCSGPTALERVSDLLSGPESRTWAPTPIAVETISSFVTPKHDQAHGHVRPGAPRVSGLSVSYTHLTLPTICSV
eukprot:2764506-Alexandrium_andersonii.AAC.1